MRHLGLHIYFWSSQAPRRLVTDLLEPLLVRLRRRQGETFLWFTFFDARAPHLFAVFGLPGEPVGSSEAGTGDPTRQMITQTVSDYLAGHPIADDLTAEQIEDGHRQCRGKALNAVDAEPGLAQPNTFRVFEQPCDGYPFSGLASDEALRRRWRLWSHSLDWVLRNLRTQPANRQAAASTHAALRWIAAMALALERSAPEMAEPYWRHHACTLIYPLAERLRTEEAEVLEALPDSISERNRQIFARAWQVEDRASEDRATDVSAYALGHAEPLVRDLLQTTDSAERIQVLREINHITLLQLFQPVRAHIPLVLFAWWRSLTQLPSHRNLEPGVQEICHV